MLHNVLSVLFCVMGIAICVSDLDLGMILTAAESRTTSTAYQSAAVRCKIKRKVKCNLKRLPIPRITDKGNILIKADGRRKK